jgi:hypothetical protein
MPEDSPTLRSMNCGPIVYLSLLLLLPGLLGGCASNSSGHASITDPVPQKKGHWVTVPPQTGSLIPTKVWVEDTGEATGSPSVNNVQNGSAADVQRMQNSSRNFKPAGS